MDEKTIKNAWLEIRQCMGKHLIRREKEIRVAAQKYAQAVLDANDEERIKYLGLKHLRRVAKGELGWNQLWSFYTHSYEYENRME